MYAVSIAMARLMTYLFPSGIEHLVLYAFRTTPRSSSEFLSYEMSYLFMQLWIIDGLTKFVNHQNDEKT